jgi:hypothetical protein
MDSESKESIDSSPRIEDFSTNRIEISRKGSMLVNVKVVAVDRWENMLSATQKDYRERGIVISRKGNRLFTSKVAVGNDIEPGDTNIGERTFPIPFLPHGIRSLDPTMKDIVVVHTHPMLSELDHLRTSIISDLDIHSFVASDYKSLVMIDRGGAHLLVRNSFSPDEEERLLRRKIVKETTKKIKEQEGGTLEVMQSLDLELRNYGLRYFFTPFTEPDSSGKFIEFHLPQNVERKDATSFSIKTNARA